MAPASRKIRRSRKPDPRAEKSGFGPKLRKWLDRNRDAYEAGQDVLGPRNARQLSKTLAARGEKVSDVAIGWWVKGYSLPDPRFIGHLEQLMGAAWSYLDDPTTPWPRKWSRDAVYELISLFGDASLDRLAERVRRELADLRPRATGR